MAAFIQWPLEETVFALLNRLYDKTRVPTSVTRAALRLTVWRTERSVTGTLFTELYIQPAAGDAGLASGGCVVRLPPCPRGQLKNSTMSHASWGPEYGDEVLRKHLASTQLNY